mmetsp:Transcript_5438/g.11896  ORF Transcript_5438/g.11896 Transcript_5438/m.11896 type:complete len:560 (-) Transcript_5438:104-1783(-)
MIKNNQSPSRRQQRHGRLSFLFLLFLLLLSLVAVINTLVVSIYVASPDPRPSLLHHGGRTADVAAANQVPLPGSNDKTNRLQQVPGAGVGHNTINGNSPRKEATENVKSSSIDRNSITVHETGSFANCTAHLPESPPHPPDGDSSHPDGKSITVSCHTFHYRMPPIPPPSNGKSNPRTGNIQIVIGVLSASNAEGSSRRQAIRDTWAGRNRNPHVHLHDPMMDTATTTNPQSSSAAPAESSTAVYFVVAGPWQTIRNEYERRRDLIWIDQTEVYDGENSVLTFKTLGFLKIVHDAMEEGRDVDASSWKDVRYVFKTDDDCFVNIDLLRAHLLGNADGTDRRDGETALDDDGRRNNALRESETTAIHYWGNCHTDEKLSPLRGARYKWGISEKLYPERFYPPYCQGVGFALSRDFVSCAASDRNRRDERLEDRFRNLEENDHRDNHIANMRFMPFEDVAVGILAERCGVKPTSIDDPRLIKQYRTNLREERLKIKNGMAKIGKGKLPVPDMEGRIVQHRIYDAWDMMEHYKQLNDPENYKLTTEFEWYEPKASELAPKEQ